MFLFCMAEDNYVMVETLCKKRNTTQILYYLKMNLKEDIEKKKKRKKTLKYIQLILKKCRGKKKKQGLGALTPGQAKNPCRIS